MAGKLERRPLEPAQIYERLKEKFGDDVSEPQGGGADKIAGDPWIEVAPARIAEVGLFIRDEEDLWFDSLMNLATLDRSGLKAYQKSKEPEAEAARRFVTVYCLHSMLHRHKITLKCHLPEEEPVTLGKCPG